MPARSTQPATIRICIDADCPQCGYPERWADLATRTFGCRKCSYRSQHRDR